MSSLEYVDSCLESDFESGSVESTEDDRNEDPAHVFHGVSYTVGPLGNGQIIKAVWRYSQLHNLIYPAFMRSFRALGFQFPVDWKALLYKIACGGFITLKGPKFNNEASYNTTSIEDEFMLRERALAKKLLKIVFSIDDTLSYMRKRISFEKEAIYFEYKPSLALRKTILYFCARGQNPKDLYRIIIEGSGSGENLKSHLFQFQPSGPWLCNRFPENVY